MGQVVLRSGVQEWTVATKGGRLIQVFSDWRGADEFAKAEARRLRRTLVLWTSIAYYAWED